MQCMLTICASFEIVDSHERLFVVGTTLATFSAYRCVSVFCLRGSHSVDQLRILLRLVKHAVEQRKPVMLLNVGPTRADQLLGIETIEIPAGAVIRDVVKAVLYVLVDLP